MAKITVASSPAFGKTELVKILNQRLGGEAYYEIVEDDPFMEKFYDNKERFSFAMQIKKMNERLGMFKDSGNIRGSRETWAEIDQNLFYDMVYSKANWLLGTMDDDEYRLYRETAENYRDKMYYYAPDLDVVLVGSFEHEMNNMNKRGREFEVTQPGTPEWKYFETLNKLNNEYASEYHGFPKLVIDVTGRDFVANSDDREHVLRQIWDKLLSLDVLSQAQYEDLLKGKNLGHQ